MSIKSSTTPHSASINWSGLKGRRKEKEKFGKRERRRRGKTHNPLPFKGRERRGKGKI